MMKNKNRFLVYLSFIIVVFMTQHLLAATEEKSETWYQIEILVYEPIELPIANESWPAILNEDNPDLLIELAPIAKTTVVNKSNRNTIKAFQLLPTENLVLTATANKIRKSGRYRVITLQAWQQPVKQRHEAVTVHLTDKQQTSDLIINNDEGNLGVSNVLNPASENIALTIESEFDENNFIVKEIPTRIDGTVTISLSRYLHMALNIRYYNPDVYLAEQIARQELDEEIIELFEMKQSRRMRSKELHVFDHPYFGIIATIIPIKRTKP